MRIAVCGIFFALFFSLGIIEIHAQVTDQIRAEFCEKNWRRAPDMCSEFIPEGYSEEKASKGELTNEDRIKLDELEASVYGYVECPIGSHQKAVSGGEIICIDSITRQQVEPIITNEIQLTDEQFLYIGIGVIILIIIIAGIAKAAQKKSEPEVIPRRNWSENEKEVVRIRQDGKCKMCHKPPPRWEYDHIDGNRETEIKFWHEKDSGFKERKPISVSNESLV